MMERIVFLLLFVAACVAGYYALRAWQTRRLHQLAGVDAPQPVVDALDEAVAKDSPALLYFTTPDCAQCRFQQRPILERLATLTPIPVVTVDAIQREDLARHFGVMTVPTTVVLDSKRRPVAINHGVAPLQKLRGQLELVGVLK